MGRRGDEAQKGLKGQAGKVRKLKLKEQKLKLKKPGPKRKLLCPKPRNQRAKRRKLRAKRKKPAKNPEPVAEAEDRVPEGQTGRPKDGKPLSRRLEGGLAKLRPLSPESDIRFPGESGEYRRERNRLLEAEVELRRATERVAAQRRALPLGGVVKENYRFEEVVAGGEVGFCELFAAGKDTLVVYSFMFPRWSGDTRPGPAGESGKLPLAETPCASCTSILDSLDGAARHLEVVLNLAVVAKSDPERIRTFARERGWRNLRLLSSQNNTYNRDYHAETTEGDQVPMLNVFMRDRDQIRHAWATELMFAPRDEGLEARHVDSIWPIWNVLDMTPEGRSTGKDFPKLDYK